MPDILETLTRGAINVSDNVDSFVNIIVLLLAIYFADKWRQRFFPSDDEKILAFEKERLLLAAAEGAQVPRGTMSEAIEHVASKRPAGAWSQRMKGVGEALARLDARCRRAEEEFPKLAAPDGTVAVPIGDLRLILNAASRWTLRSRPLSPP